MKRLKKIVSSQSSRSLHVGARPRLPVFPHLVAHSGIPSTADALAYEPVQRLLAVGTLDGRIKLLGRSGVERLFLCRDKQPTQQLHFLTNRGGLLRLSKLGSIELWSLCSGRPLETIDLDAGDGASCICTMPGEPYLLIGCKSGDLRIGCLLDNSKEAVNDGREVAGIDLLSYRVSRLKFKAVGEVLSVNAVLSDNGPLLLALHSGSGATVWDIRAQRPIIRVTQARDAGEPLASAGPATAACWVGTQCFTGHFATGHESGDIFVWSIPQSSQRVFGGTPTLVTHLRVAPHSSAARRVMALSFVSGPQESLLVFGGQPKEQPDTLTLIHLPEHDLGKSNKDTADVACLVGGNSIPWFGNICSSGWSLVPPDGSLKGNSNPVAILILTEGGHLVLQELQTLTPIPFTLPLQSLPPVAMSLLAEIPAQATSSRTGVSELKQLRSDPQCNGDFDGVLNSDWAWVISAGQAPDGSEWSHSTSPLYVSAHDDGRIRVWDLMGQAPEWLTTVPSPIVEKEVSWKKKQISAMRMSLSGDLLAVGHAGGEIEVYQFCGVQRHIKLRTCSRKLEQEQDSVESDQPPGYQLILRAEVHTSTICCLSFDANCRLLAAGDDSGRVSIVDLAAPGVKFLTRVCECGVHDVAFGGGPTRGSSGLLASTTSSQSSDRFRSEMVLYMVNAESSVAAVELENGQIVSQKGGWLNPKNTSKALCMLLLDHNGRIVPPCVEHVDIPWLLHSKQRKGSIGTTVIGNEAGQGGDRIGREAEGKMEQLPQQEARSQDPLSNSTGADNLPSEKPGTSPSKQGSEQAGNDGAESPVEEDTNDEEDDSDMLAAAVAKLEGETGREKQQHRRQISQSWLGQKVGSIGKGVTGVGRGVAGVGKKVINKGKGLVAGHEGMTHASSAPSSLMSSAASSTRDHSGGEVEGESSVKAPPQTVECTEIMEVPQALMESQLAEPDSMEVPTTADDDCVTVCESAVGYLLIATDQYLRLYTPEGIVSEDRSTANRASFSTPIIFAAPLAPQKADGCGIVCITNDYAIQVYQLPNLELWYEVDIVDVLGWRWNWVALDCGAKFAGEPGGQVAFVSSCGELVRMGIVGGCSHALVPKSVYNWELAVAAQDAKSVAQLIATKSSGSDKAAGISPGTLGGELKKGLDVLVSAAKHATDELNKVAGTVAKSAAGGATVAGATDDCTMLPDLHSLFHSEDPRSPVSLADDRGGDFVEGDDHGRITAIAALPGAVSGSNRDELLQGARSIGDTFMEPRQRTANEIKAAYGRTKPQTGDTARGIMEENMAGLHERGEKLRRLQDRTAELENEARGFESRARELAQQQKKKSWWLF